MKLKRVTMDPYLCFVCPGNSWRHVCHRPSLTTLQIISSAMKGHSTELLLVKMTEEWRRALDNNLVVGVVFVDFRKAFDSISHPVLLRKLQELGVSGNIWSWIKNYLSNRYQVTVINGHTSKSLPVKFGVPQGSVLGPILFSLFCNDLPDINESKEGKIFMYADDTTLYAIAPNHDLVAIILNKMLEKLFN